MPRDNTSTRSIGRSLVWAIATAVVLGAGTVSPAAAQPSEEAEPSVQDEQDDDVARRRQEALERRRQLQQQRQQQQQQQQQQQPGVVVPGQQVNPEEQAAEGLAPEEVGELIGSNEALSLSFDGPVQYTALLELISETLAINFVIDPSLRGRTIEFRAPLEIPADEQLDFIETLLDNEGFVIFRDANGLYFVEPAQQPKPTLGPEDIEDGTTRVYREPLLLPSELQQQITTALGQGAPELTRIRFGALDDLGILVVTASRPTLRLVDDVVARLIIESDLSSLLHRFPVLNVSSPTALERVLNLAGTTGGGGAQAAPTGPRVGRTQQGQQGAQPTAVAAGGALSDRLSVDPRGNALLFRGTVEEAARVRELVRLADEVTQLIVVRYVPGAVINDVLQAAQQLGLGSVETSAAGQAGGRARTPVTNVNQNQAIAAGSRFVIDEVNGTFLYFGTSPQQEIVDRLVEDFRASAISQQRVVRTYKLRYATAAGSGDGGEDAGVEVQGIVDILQQLIEPPEQQQTNAPLLPGSSPEERAIEVLRNVGVDDELIDTDALLAATPENTTIVADSDRNQIIIYAPPAAQEQFAKLINDLDQKLSQVLVQVTIVSITRDEDFDLATDFAVSTGQFSIAGGDQTGDTFGFPSGSFGTGGLSVGVLDSANVRFGIRALEEDGRGRVFSSPQLVVTDGGTATLESLAEVPFSSSVQDGSGNVTVTQGGTAEAGTNLEITPRIGAGGDVVLDYTLELSTFTGPAAGGLQPPAARENYASTVILPTDTTLVVGGLRSYSRTEGDAGIPFLKDIPLIGLPFKDLDFSTTVSTIYVFITPRILNDDRNEKWRLLSDGPLGETGVGDGWPELEPAVIPITPYVPLDARLLPENRLSERNGPDAGGEPERE
ncbi:MAG: secretin N-terminal domain-containing protein [Planctomycetota bacterium]